MNDLSQKLTNELFEEVTIFQARANQRRFAGLCPAKARESWRDQLIEVVKRWQGYIDNLKQGPRIRTAVAESAFVSGFTENFKQLAVMDLECHGVRPETAQKLVNALID